MSGFVERYLAGLRWTELFMGAALAFLAAIQYETQQGKTFHQALPAALTAAVSAALLYFRVPKEAGGAVADREGAALLPLADRFEAALARGAAPVDLSSGSGEALGALREPGTTRLEDLAPVAVGALAGAGKSRQEPAPPDVFPPVALRGVNSHIERVGDRTVYVMDPEPAPAPAPSPAPARSEIDEIAAAVAARLKGQ